MKTAGSSMATDRPARTGRRALAWRAALLVLFLLIGLPPGQPTFASVTLVDFRATAQDTVGILVYWETATEFQTVAFSLDRSESAGGPWGEPIDQQAARGDGVTGATYTYLDREVTAGVRYYYLLTEIPSGGEAGVFGPVSAGIGLAEPPTLTPTATSTRTPTATATATGTLAATATATVTRTPTTVGTVTVDPNPGHPTATRQFTNTPRPTVTSVPTLPQTLGQTPPPNPTVPSSDQTVLATPTGGPALQPTSFLLPQESPVTTVIAGPTGEIATPSVAAAAASPDGSMTPAVALTETPAVFEARPTDLLLPGAPRPRATSTATPAPRSLGSTGVVLGLGAAAIVLAAALVVGLAAFRRSRHT